MYLDILISMLQKHHWYQGEPEEGHPPLSTPVSDSPPLCIELD